MTTTTRPFRPAAFARWRGAAAALLVILASATTVVAQAAPAAPGPAPAGGAAGGASSTTNDWNGVLGGAKPAPTPTQAPAPQPAAQVNPAPAAGAAISAPPPPGASAPAAPPAVAATPPAPAAAASDFAKTAVRRSAGGDKSTPTTAPVTTSGAGDVLRVVMALAIVLAIIFFLKWGSRRFFAMPSAARSSRAVNVLSRTVLSPKQQLVLLQVGQRVLVVADSGASMNSLCEITDPDEIASLVGQLRAEKVSVATNAFGGLFDRVRKRFAGGHGDEDGGEEDGQSDAARSERAQLLESSEDVGYDEAETEEAVTAARHELDGLRDRLRQVSKQYAEPDAAERA